VAPVLVNEVFYRAAAPKELLSDQGAQFVSDLWLELMKYAGIKKLSTTAYHPQTDGEVERFNHTLEVQLRAQVGRNHRDWDLYLPAATYAYNTAPHAATGETPFFLVYGRDPYTMFDRQFWESSLSSDAASVAERKADLLVAMKEVYDGVRANLLASAARMEEVYNKTRTRPAHFEVGDLVMLHRSLRPEDGQTHKLLPRYGGPYRVEEVIGPLNYRIKGIANTSDEQTVHVTRLKKYVVNPLNPIGPTGNNEFDVEDILDRRVRDDGVVEYLVDWKGYTKSKRRWVPESELLCPEILTRFLMARSLSGPTDKVERAEPTSKLVPVPPPVAHKEEAPLPLPKEPPAVLEPSRSGRVRHAPVWHQDYRQ
jgi:hypothetical protein